MKKNKYFSLEKSNNIANLYIYGEITSWPWLESDVSSYNLSKQLEELKDVDEINVFINSYGGEVAEGIAIYNALKRFKGKVRTIVDGVACSVASVIFMAGEERIMNNPSLLLIHNAWMYASGDANELRKSADDLDKMTELSIEIYLSKVNITREELQKYMDDETWLNQEEAVTYGFATKVDDDDSKNANQSYRAKMFKQLLDEDVTETDDSETETDNNEEEKNVTKVTISVKDGYLNIETEEETTDEDVQDDETTTDDVEVDEDDDSLFPDTEETSEEKNDNDFKEKLLKVFKGGIESDKD